MKKMKFNPLEHYYIGQEVRDNMFHRNGNVIKVTKSSLTVKYQNSKTRYNDIKPMFIHDVEPLPKRISED